MTQPVPVLGARFSVDGAAPLADGSGIVAHFSCDVHGRFAETVTLGPPSDAARRYLAGDGAGLVALLGVALGVSYYKLAAAASLRLPSLPAGGIAMARALYEDGLAEFRVRAGLPFPVTLAIDAPAEAGLSASGYLGALPTRPALVAFGGGKDSHVAEAILRRAGTPTQLASVVLNTHVSTALTAMAPRPVTFFARTLDARLKVATALGFNGHVPITAINMLTLTLAARLSGLSQVVFANERSADEPTMILPGGAANHQYSKSSAFERLVQAAIAAADPHAPVPYSILRPYSELWIGKAFSRLDYAFGRFSSCNRNFRMAGDADARWCGACAKCAFTALILAPFIDPGTHARIFGGRFLDAPALQPYFAELVGLGTQKPWDCVGTLAECRAALATATERFGPSAASAALLPALLETYPPPALSMLYDEALAPWPTTRVPPAYLNAAAELAA